MDSKKLEFWNSRANLGLTAGSNDFMLKKLEIELIFNKILPDSYVLDIGCGNGETLIKLSKEKNCNGIGIDFSEEMVKSASTNSEKNSKLTFMVATIPNLPAVLGEFDYVITERCLINLESEVIQYKAFLEIMSHVKPGGYYLMIESSRQGLERTNTLRQLLGLEAITIPWHNLFFDEEQVITWQTKEFVMEEVYPFSSTYHFLSRVLYAKLAADKGEELRYDSDINMISLKLPPIGNFGPARLWLWRRN